MAGTFSAGRAIDPEYVPGTFFTSRLRRLAPLFEPLSERLIEHYRQEHPWHADETRWLVFATLDGKVGHR